jgi:pimeloyl-ACP methyl ester carboxylesterase
MPVRDVLEVLLLLCCIGGIQVLESNVSHKTWTAYGPSLKAIVIVSALTTYQVLWTFSLILSSALLMPIYQSRHFMALAALPGVMASVAVYWPSTRLPRVFRGSMVSRIALAYLVYETVGLLWVSTIYRASYLDINPKINLERDRLHCLSMPSVSQVWIESKHFSVGGSSDGGVKLDGIVYRPSKSTLQGVDAGTRWMVAIASADASYELQYEEMVQLATRLKTNLLLYNPRGVGRSTGLATRARHLVLDAASAVRFVMDHHRATQESILVYGHDIGGGVACALVADHFPQLRLVVDRSFTALSEAMATANAGLLPGWLVAFAVQHYFGDLDNVAAWQRIPHRRKLILYHPEDLILPLNSSSLARIAPEALGSDPSQIVPYAEGGGQNAHFVMLILAKGHDAITKRIMRIFPLPRA